ncbi:MAG: hypothetical protein ACYCY2_10660, partial [Acidithiobacillus ferriphilus]
MTDIAPLTIGNNPSVTPARLRLGAMEYRKLWAVGVVFVLLTVLGILLTIHQSYNVYRTISKSTHLRAKIAAQSAARQVSAGLDRPFNDLYYISNALLPAGAQLTGTTLEQIQIIRVWGIHLTGVGRKLSGWEVLAPAFTTRSL